MPKRKLTASLKENIKKDYHRLRQSDFDGEALAYLRQVRGGHKGRKAQKVIRAEKKQKLEKQIPGGEPKPAKGRKYKIIVDGREILPGSQAYLIIEASANNTGKTIKRFVEENREALGDMLRDYLIFTKKEIDDLRKLIKVLPKGSKIHSPVKHRTISAKTASLNLHLIKKTLIDTCDVYPYIFIEYAFDLEANLHFNCPRPGEYKDLEDCESLREFLEDQYPNITWIEHDQAQR